MNCESCQIECNDQCRERVSRLIWQNVQDFDNSDYEKDYVKITICKHFGVDNWDNTGRKEPNITAKQLFIYALLTRFKMRIVDICKAYGLRNCDVIYIRHKWDKKLSCSLTNTKYITLINSK